MRPHVHWLAETWCTSTLICVELPAYIQTKLHFEYWHTDNNQELPAYIQTKLHFEYWHTDNNQELPAYLHTKLHFE